MPLLRLATALAVGLLASGLASAQPYPSRPIRIVIPYPAGGTTDIIARALQEPLRAALNQPLVIDNKGGGAGATGIREVIQAQPDGYTLVISNNGPTTILPLVQPGIGYEATGSMAPVSLLSLAPLVLVVPATLPVTSLRQFIEHLRANPGRLNYGTAGVGSFGHVATLLMSQMANVQATHVPYRGQAPMTLAVVSGEVDFVLTSYSQPMNEQVEAGKLRRLAVSTTEPSPLVPGAPAIAEMLPGYAAEVWFGMLAPRGTPALVIDRLNAVLRDALALPAVQQQLLGAGMLAGGSSPAAFARRLEQEAMLLRQVITAANIKPE